MEETQIQLVQQWHEAFNMGDTRRLDEISRDVIELLTVPSLPWGNARFGVGEGRFMLKPLGVYYKPGCVIVQQRIEYGTGEKPVQETATAFRFQDDYLYGIEQYVDLEEALWWEGSAALRLPVEV